MLIACFIGILLCHRKNTALKSHEVATLKLYVYKIDYDF